jgi:hypothetical protein
LSSAAKERPCASSVDVVTGFVGWFVIGLGPLGSGGGSGGGGVGIFWPEEHAASTVSAASEFAKRATRGVGRFMISDLPQPLGEGPGPGSARIARPWLPQIHNERYL